MARASAQRRGWHATTLETQGGPPRRACAAQGDRPTPMPAGGNEPSGIEAANRMRDFRELAFYVTSATSPSFTRDTRSAMVRQRHSCPDLRSLPSRRSGADGFARQRLALLAKGIQKMPNPVAWTRASRRRFHLARITHATFGSMVRPYSNVAALWTGPTSSRILRSTIRQKISYVAHLRWKNLVCQGTTQ